MYDGSEMIRMLRESMLESSNTNFLTDYVSYRYINEAASNWVFRTNSLKATQNINTVADQAEYTLAADHLNIYTEINGERFIQYNNGSTNSFPKWKNYSEIVHKSTNPSTTVPGRFSVIDHPDLGDIISGTTTSAGTSTRGESTLTDSGGGFLGNVSVGDVVQDTSQNTFGIVISVISDTALLTALFSNSASDQGWTNGDSYIIVPQGRLQLHLDPPPTTASHTLTIYYTARPIPVFSSNRIFRIQSQYIPQIIRDAKALYEFRGGDYQTGSADKQLADRGTAVGNIRYDKGFGRKGYKVRLRGLR